MAAMPRSWACWLETEPAAANLRRVVPFWQSSRFAHLNDVAEIKLRLLRAACQRTACLNRSHIDQVVETLLLTSDVRFRVISRHRLSRHKASQASPGGSRG